MKMKDSNCFLGMYSFERKANTAMKGKHSNYRVAAICRTKGMKHSNCRVAAIR